MKSVCFFVFALIFLLACTTSTAPVVLEIKPTAAPTATSLPQIKQVELDKLVVKSHTMGRLNIRSCPSTRCPVIGYFEPFVEVVILGGIIPSEKDNKLECGRGWYKVQWLPTDNKIGYSCADWIEK